MTRNTFALLICVCVSFVLNAQPTLSATISDPSAPKMVFDSTTYWFDTVYQGSTIDHEFRFMNKGKTPLIISNVTGSSGCIVPSYPKEPIAPGKSAVIGVVFNTTGKFGQQEKCVTVTSNAQEPTVVLHIKGVVTLPPPDPNAPVLKFDSTTFWFDTITQGTIVEHEYRFINTGKSPLVITEVLTNCGCLVADYPKEPIPPGGTGVIRLRFNSTGKAGMQDKAPTVYSNNAQGVVVIHIKGFVRVPPEKYSGPSPAPTNK